MAFQAPVETSSGKIRELTLGAKKTVATGGQNALAFHGFEGTLPRGGKGGEPAPVRDLTVAILADGRTVLGGQVVEAAALAEAFEAARVRSPSTVVLVQADEGVAHGRVVAVMDLARRHGLSRLAIATRSDSGGGR